MRRFASRFVTLLTLGLAACRDSNAPNDAVPAGARVVVSTPLDTATAFRTQQTGIATAERTVVREAAAWSALWDRVVAAVAPRPPAPAVDFSRDMVLFAAAGTRSSGGYSLSFDTVYEVDGGYYAVVTETVPGTRCGSLAVITAPAAAVRVPRIAGAVRFVEKRETYAC